MLVLLLPISKLAAKASRARVRFTVIAFFPLSLFFFLQVPLHILGSREMSVVVLVPKPERPANGGGWRGVCV